MSACSFRSPRASFVFSNSRRGTKKSRVAKWPTRLKNQIKSNLRIYYRYDKFAGSVEALRTMLQPTCGKTSKCNQKLCRRPAIAAVELPPGSADKPAVPPAAEKFDRPLFFMYATEVYTEVRLESE